MSELADLLELLHTATSRYRTLRATVGKWVHHGRARRAMERFQAASGGSEGIISRPALRTAATTSPEFTTEMLRVWMARPSSIRVERDRGPLTHTYVSDGDRWWTYDESAGAVSGDRPAGLAVHGLQTLFDPSWIVAGVDLAVAGRTQQGGRDVIRLLATPRPTLHGHSPEAWFADRWDLRVDAERGLLLRMEGILDGEGPIGISEVNEIIYDEPIAASVFTFVPPPGVAVRSSADLPRYDPVPIEDAAQRAGFRVFIPARVPVGSRLQARLMPSSDQPPAMPTLLISYQLPGLASHQLVISQVPVGGRLQACDAGHERLALGEQEIFVHDYRTQRKIHLEREGTLITFDSDLDRDTLLAIVDSLGPAPDRPPALSSSGSLG